MEMRVQVGMIVFPDVLQMDLTGPYGIFAAAPGAVVDLVWKDTNTVTSADGLVLTPTRSFGNCPQLDVLCVPGGSGILPLLEDEATLAFIRQQADKASYVCSVCTGALVLGAAGQLRGHRATTHWQSLEMLAELGAIPVQERVVLDGNRITSAGVSAGMDMALVLVGEIWGADVAREIELNMEYDPRPPFKCGSPLLAPRKTVERVIYKNLKRQETRLEAVRRAAKRLPPFP